MRLHDAVQLYCEQHLRPRYRDWTHPYRLCQRYLKQLPNVELGELCRKQVVAWHNYYGARYPRAANAALSHLSMVYAKMILWEEYDGKNPAQYVKPFVTARRMTILTEPQILPVMNALIQKPLEQRLFLLTIMMTGCRRNEIRQMQWSQVNLETGTWILPRTKNGRQHQLYLPVSLRVSYRELAAQERGPYVFSVTGDAPWGRTTIYRYWAAVRQLAAAHGVRLHDLRRTLVSYFCDRGQKEIAQLIVNHESIKTTEHYHVKGSSPVVSQAIEAYAQRFQLPEAGTA